MTTLLSDLDSYIYEFDCTVLDVLSDENNLYIVTDRTAFFPEGGGQSSDVGFLNDVYIKDVQTKSGTIYHIADLTEKSKISVGDCLQGKVDMKNRFLKMQQHTGEHMFSGFVHKKFGFDNVGFHLGEACVTMDFNGELTFSDCIEIEKEVNRAIFKNHPVRQFYPTKEEAEKLPYRSKKEIFENLRLVEICGVDLCACCAPHVKMTGEVGICEILFCEKHRGGTRIYALWGEKATLDIRQKLLQNKEISRLLCAKETETAQAVKKLAKDCKQNEFELSKARLETLKIHAETDVENSHDAIMEFVDFSNINLMREYANILKNKTEKFAGVIFCGETEAKYVFISNSGYDLQDLCKKLNQTFNGKGGGRNGIVQGSLKCNRKDLEHFIENKTF